MNSQATQLSEVGAFNPAPAVWAGVNAPTVISPLFDDEPGNASMNAGVVLGAAGWHSAISPRRGTLSVIVRTYKAAVTTACRRSGEGGFAWQRSFHEHVVRDARELDAVRRYIRLNPLRWELDRDNPANQVRQRPPTTIADYLADLGKS